MPVGEKSCSADRETTNRARVIHIHAPIMYAMLHEE